ncbi:PIG-L family deacetylase [Sphingomonas sp. S1-29]|uniref:PIG-L deacetylase family protein n=1 Tax=Sphingomonas sp. S1-29 TaxID=2991074 RepID=UPI0022402A52|nr:PIG-L family deacetylase [Sphingomonas sp. S1-29]UZK70478.1 PIG-L family deacetylase [Sphingomonas sp. S1-29]
MRSALVVAPHADDETIGAYGLIRALTGRGARVTVAVVTDGAGSHPNSIRWRRPRLVAARRRETLEAMHRIGVPAGRVVFVGLPDGALPALAVPLRRTLARLVRRHRELDLLIGPARDDDHPDHRAIAQGLPQTGARRLEYLVWPNRQSGSAPATHWLRLGGLAAAKRGAIGRYRTQTGTITDDPGGFTMSRQERARFARPVEHFRERRV